MIEWLLFIMAAFNLFGAMGDKIQENRNNYTKICIVCIAAMTIIELMKG